VDGYGLTDDARASWRPGPWLGAAIVVIGVAGALPLAWLVLTALGDAATLGSVLMSRRTVVLLSHTVALGTGVALLAGAAGIVFALLTTKTDLPGRRALAALLTFPLFLPPYSLALAWFTVLGRHGLGARFVGAAAAEWSSDVFFGLAGAVLVLTTAYTPIVLWAVAITLGSVDPATEEAAQLRFRWRRVVAAIDLPLVAPAVVAGMLLTFALVVGEFGVPAYLRYPVFSGAVFTQFAAFLDVGTAVVTSIPLAVLVVAAVVAQRAWLGRPVQFLDHPRMVVLLAPLGGWRAVATIGAWAYGALTVVLPIGALAAEAAAGASYRRALEGAGSSIVTSLWTAGTAASVAVVVGLLLAYVVRAARAWRGALEAGLFLLFAAPGTVLGVALILLWNRRGLTAVYASALIVVIGYVAHYTPLAAQAVGVGLDALSPGIEDAARLAAVPWTTTVRRVLVPLLVPTLVGAWFLTFVFCLRDLDLVMTVHPPGVETLPVRVYTLMANSPGPVTAAQTLLMMAVTLVVVSAAGVALAAARRVSAAWT
jgi:iron(III) transport system permease protein